MTQTRKLTLLDKKEVIKHSSTIQISNKVTLFQRKAWNIMLAHAFYDLENDDIKKFQIPIKTLCFYLGYKYEDKITSSKLEKILENLVETKIKWNILGKDNKREWGVASLLAGCKVKDGICEYDYSIFLREQLSNPSIFARISLTIQAKFKSKYALALYELFIDYKRISQTPWIPMADFRDLMGFENEEYKLFKHLNNDIIKPSIIEINKHSNLFVSVEYQKIKRKVTALKFNIQEQKELSPIELIDQDAEVSYQRLKELGFSNIGTIRKKHSIEILRQALDDLEFEIKRRKNENQKFSLSQQGGWLQNQLKNVQDGQYQFSFHYQKHLEDEKKRQENRAKQAKMETEIKHKLEAEKEQQQKTSNLITAKIENLSLEELQDIEAEARKQAELTVKKPVMNTESQEAALKKFKELSELEQREIEKEARENKEIQQIIKSAGISLKSRAIQTAIENIKIEIVKKRYSHEFDLPAMKRYQASLDRTVKINIRKIVQDKYDIG